MIKIYYEKRIFEIPKSDLEKIGQETKEEILDKERRRGIIANLGIFAIASGLEIPSCFACGDFEDYSGRCRYESKVKATIDGKTGELCRKYDIVILYAIESGYMDNYEVRSTKKNKKKK